MLTYRVNYVSFEGNERWAEYEMEDGATPSDVESRIACESHVCGDEICTILTIEEV